MTAYRGPREGHDAWQGDVFHEHLMEKTATHIGLPGQGLNLHKMDQRALLALIHASEPIARKRHYSEALEKQAEANRQHHSYEKHCRIRERLVEHPDAKKIFEQMHELLKETHGMITPERNLEVHDELRALQNQLDDLHKEHE